MNRNRKAVLLGVLTLLIGFSLIGSYSKKGMCQAPPIRLGVIGPLSGVHAPGAKSVLAANEIAAEEFNKAGGILGRKIELLSRDDQGKPETSARMAKELIERHKVTAIVGPLISHCTLATISVTNEYNVLQITGGSNAETLVVQAFKRNYFQVCPNSYMEARAQMRVVVDDPQLKTYALLCSDFEWGRTFATFAKQILAKERPDMKLVGEWWPPYGESQFTGYITAILTAKPDCIISALGPFPPFAKQAKMYGLFEKMKVLGSLFITETMALGKETPEGIYSINRGPFYFMKGPKMMAFSEKYIKKEGNYPDEFSMMTYDAFHALMDGIKKANSFETSAIIEAMENMTFDTCSGKRYFRKVDHQMNSPLYTGVTTYVPEYPFAVMKNIKIIKAEDTWRSPEEILKLREAAKK